MIQTSRRIIRSCLKRLYRNGKIYPVPFGPNRSHRLKYDPSLQLHQMLGLYDLKIFGALERMVFAKRLFSQGSIFCDVGANVGYYSLWLSRKATELQGRVYAFEPSSLVQGILKDNIAANRLKNIEVVSSAVADRAGTIEFHQSPDHHCSSLLKQSAGQGASMIQIPTTSLDAYFEENALPFPSFIKMDIEGAGTLALKGCNKIFEQARPVMLIESHTPEEDRAISDAATKHGYHIFRPSDGRWLESPSEVGGTLLLFPAELEASA